MPTLPAEIPNRPFFKASEVCEIAQLQPYVLRSWELEFPDLGRANAGTRIYRRADIARVLEIRRLVFDEGLTLAGARRRILEESGRGPGEPAESGASGEPDEAGSTADGLVAEWRRRLVTVREGLREVLSLLDRDGEPPRAAARETAGAAAVKSRAREPRRRAARAARRSRAPRERAGTGKKQKGRARRKRLGM